MDLEIRLSKLLDADQPRAERVASVAAIVGEALEGRGFVMTVVGGSATGGP